jgi:hypothetical protein
VLFERKQKVTRPSDGGFWGWMSEMPWEEEEEVQGRMRRAWEPVGVLNSGGELSMGKIWVLK